MKIKEVIVVEGYHDASKLKQFFDVDVIITNGSAINKETLDLIKRVNEQKGVIVFLDPDYPGEQIRNKIINYVGDCKHAFIEKKFAISKNGRKVGIEHSNYDDLLHALKKCVTFAKHESLSWDDYLLLDFIGSKANRMHICNKLNIAMCNTKTLFKRINMLNLTKDDIQKIMNGDC